MVLNPTSLDNSIKRPIDQDAWIFFRFNDHQIIQMNLAPGEALENHSNEWRIVSDILRGKGSLNMAGSTLLPGEGQSIAVQAGKEILELLVIKTKAPG